MAQAFAASSGAYRQETRCLCGDGHGDVKRLKGQAGARLRVGDWRVIFYEEGGTIVVAAVGHRREIYD
jgi:mRNA interferase RelE/StbE